VTHDAELAAIADQQIVLRDGRVVDHVTPRPVADVADLRVGSRADG
jgi:ABC-type lipoprotein export system ATPase subunit